MGGWKAGTIRGLRLAILLALLAAAVYLLLPRPELLDFQGQSRAFYDRHGRLLRLSLAADQRYRLRIPLDRVAPVLREATLLYEDRNFYAHPGVDVPALFRACYSTYLVGERPIGASTISMQVARLRWNLHTRTIAGKLLQIGRALQLSRHYGKDELFAAYLNLACYGRNIEGIEAASRIYFDKAAAELTLPEALTLCVIPQNPVQRNPTTAAGFARLKIARDQLFQRWLEEHPEDAQQRVFFQLPLAIRPLEQLPFTAPHFVTELDRQLPPLQGGAVPTTLDSALQQRIERHLAAYIARRRPEGIENGAVAVLNHETMELEALVGSADFWNERIEGQVNGVSAKRSPGSTLKPFIYGLALDQQLIHPLSLLKDAPRRYGGFTPENFDQRFLGPVFARDALIGSRNVPAVYLQAQLTRPTLYDFLRTAGVQGLREEGHYGLALGLGGAELSMEELLRLYALLPNGGRLRPLRKVSSDLPPEEGPALLSPEACYLLLDILSSNPAPTGVSLSGQLQQGPEIAWKTGTSFAFRDAWAIGISGPYVIAVWCGNFNGVGNPALVGRPAAGPLLFEIFRDLGQGKGWRATAGLQPGLLNLERVAVCADSGDLPGRFCPRTRESWFIPGVSPIRVCGIHRAIPVVVESGLRACWERPGETRRQVFEFWPSDLQQIFRQAGIGLKSPPAFEADCELDEASSSGAAPVILSPVQGLSYSLRSERLAQERIPFSATVDGDVRQLYWFVDEAFVGQVAAGETFFWCPQSGDFGVQVVDDHGRGAGRNLRVGLVRDRAELVQ
ncbi:MAG: penicillin-binding protein 1C [Desulfuromonadaceae bacterium]